MKLGNFDSGQDGSEEFSMDAGRVGVLVTRCLDRPGIARLLNLILTKSGASCEAANGMIVGPEYFRAMLLRANLRSHAKLNALLHMTDLSYHLTVYAPERLWTLSMISPFAPDLEVKTSSALMNAGGNIVWENRIISRAPDTGTELFHQNLLINLHPKSSLNTLTDEVKSLENNVSGNAEVLPGACLTLFSRS